MLLKMMASKQKSCQAASEWLRKDEKLVILVGATGAVARSRSGPEKK